MRRTWMCVLVLVGCADGDPGKDTGGGHDVDDGAPTLSFTLATGTTVAGGPVAYTLEAVWPDDAREAVTGTITSDLEDPLDVGADAITATLAGVHALTAAAEVDGAPLTASAALVVEAGALASLDLALDPAEIAAAETAGWSVTGADAWGNPVAVEGATVTADPAVTVDGATLTTTTAGTWTITAALDQLSDDADLVVRPGAPAAVDLALDPTALEPGDTALATVVVTDGWGNLADDPWTLTVAGGDATVVDDAVTFDGEGVYTVTVTVDGTELTDSVGPLVVDASGPTLVVESPERGSWAPTGAATVSGTVSDDVSGVGAVDVGGVAATLPGDGTFSAAATWDFGLNVVETTASDGDGNAVDDVRGLLAGDVLPWGDAETDGLVVRLHEGAGGLDALTEGVGDLVDPAYVLADLPVPLYSEADSKCVTILGRTFCTDYELELTITDVDWASADLELDPRADGTVLATLTITDAEADWSATGEAAGSTYSATGTATADTVTVAATLLLSVDGGAVVAEVTDTDTTITNLDLALPSWATSVLAVTGYDLESEVEAQLGAAVENAFGSAVPDAISEGFGDLTVEEEIPVGDAIATLTATPSALAVDDTGITLSLATSVSVDTWALGRAAEGSLVYGYAAPAWTGTPGACMAMSADFLDQVLYAAWGGGALSMEATDEDLGVSMSLISALLPGLTDLYLTVDPLLPPVAVPGTGSAPFDLQTGELHVQLYDGSSAGTATYEVYVQMISSMDVAVSGDAITTTLGTPAVWVDVVTAPEGTDVADLEGVLELLAPSLLGTGISALGDIPIPDLAGYTLSGAAASTGGAEGGYLVVGGDLTGS